MVFTSIPIYLDPPLPNWQQPTPSLGDANDQQLQQLPIQTPPATTSIRPGSMADRARLAKIPQPEAALKCPRCDSTNTKFCYFNNYNLSQPRHLCKTCRRYWTRGGALRNVPVGGGSRRNKRTKSSTSTKPPASSSLRERSSSIHLEAPAAPLQTQPELRLPFMVGGLHHLSDQYSAIQHANVGLSYAGIQATVGGTHNNMELHIGAGTNTGSVESVEHWRYPSQTQQVPFLGGLEIGGLEIPSTMYPFNGRAAANSDQMLGGEMPLLSSGLSTQMAPVKMEESHSGTVILNRNFLGIPDQDQYWAIGGNAWTTTDLSGFQSSSTTPML